MPKKIEFDDTGLSIYANEQVALSNALIQAREKTSLLESKIELLAIFKMQDNMLDKTKIDAKGKEYNVHYVQINSYEIKELMGKNKSGSIYNRIEEVALELKQKIYIYRNPNQNQFTMDSLYGEVNYNCGVLTIEFNPSTEHLFLELKDNFTKILLDVAFRFQTNGGFQLYKLLKSFVYTLPKIDNLLDQKDLPKIHKRYSLSEFRMQLGYIDLNQPDIKKEGAKAHPNVEKMAELEKKPKYKRWVDFYERVIKPGIEEVNRISDIYIEKIDKELGPHGKVNGVIITFQKNKNYFLNNSDKNKDDEEIKKEKEIDIKNLTEDEIDRFIDEVREIIQEKLKTSEYKAIAKEANFDIDKIKKAYNILQNSTKSYPVVPFMIAAIRKDFDLPVMSNQKNGFNDFEQRKIDYDELEKILLNQ